MWVVGIFALLLGVSFLPLVFLIIPGGRWLILGFVSRLASHIPFCRCGTSFGSLSATRSSLLSLADSPCPQLTTGVCVLGFPPGGSSLLPDGHCNGHWTLPLTGCPCVGRDLGFSGSLAAFPALGLPVFSCHWHCLSRPPPVMGALALRPHFSQLFGRDQYFSPYLPRCVLSCCQLTLI